MAIVPGLDGLRVPARFTLIAVLCTAIFTGLLLARVRLAGVAREWLLFGSVALLALLETWPPPLAMASLPAQAPYVPEDATVIELPFGNEQELPALYRSMLHQRPIVNGFSGYFPMSHLTMALCLSHHDPECLSKLRQTVGPLEIVIERRADADGVWQELAGRVPDAQIRVQTAEFVIYHVPGTALQSEFEHAPIKSLTATVQSNDVALALDGNFRTQWSTGRGQATNDAVTIETDRALITGVELWLNTSSSRNYPRGLVIETSEDGKRWGRAWEGSTEQAQFMTLLASGLPGTRITFPPRQARFVRLTETLNDLGTPWSIAELAVLRGSPIGPPNSP
jgi:hypothetical protein